MWKFDEYNDSKARNRLPFMARVQAIHAYRKNPNYSKIALMFKCSAKQIRTIVKNRDKILTQYALLPKNANVTPDEDKPSNIRRRKKIALLGNVIYEWFLRARRNPSVCIISYKLIQDVALEAKRFLNVENFFPNNSWLLHFRQKFNISDSDMKIQSNDPGPTELDIEKIISEVVVREKSDENYFQRDSFGNDDSSTSSNQAFSIDGPEPSEIDFEIVDEECPSKYPELQPIDVIEIESDDDDEGDDVNGQSDERGAIKTIDQALQHLKPLEDFALMTEDYRVIGLLSQLEVILNSSKNQ